MNLKVFFLILCFGASAFAALPPFQQSAREIQLLVQDRKLGELLGSAEAIREILKTETGYVVLTRSKLLKVDIEYQSLGHPGPIPFTFRFYEPIEIDGDEP